MHGAMTHSERPENELANTHGTPRFSQRLPAPSIAQKGTISTIVSMVSSGPHQARRSSGRH